MIKFFRKIRQQLVSQNKFSKYMLYAIGEIILVMIGILLALQVNNANEHRKVKQFEKNLLIDLRATMLSQIIDLNNQQTFNEEVQNNCFTILNYLDNNLILNDTMVPYFGKSNGSWNFSLQNNGYENLQSYGFQFIDNDTLKSSLNWIYEMQIPLLKKYDEVQFLYKQNMVNPFVAEHFNITANGRFKRFQKLVPIDYSTLRANTEYRNILNINIAKRGQEVLWLFRTSNRIKKALLRIDQEILKR